MPAPVPAPPAATTARANAETASATSAPSGTASAASGDTTAHPLIQPLPVLPDDLRESAYRAIALARFTIHPDGSVDVALVKPTQNPRLNQLLLETLRNWHFFPAMKQGHPVESEQDIRVHFNIE
ncbi:energy transducer TonB [Paraburkholderia sp. EG286A]|uniref:energy transducer TonB n=1 Tax=Paraburkholderia sp. EG286A TaxID=3237014 RepID=UPI0034D29202